MADANTQLEQLFPALIEADYEITSPIDRGYNCIAWSVGDTTSWWWPVPYAGPPLGGYYWLAGLPLEETLANFVRAFKRQGFRQCQDGSLDEGYEKIAIYADATGTPTHAARQMENGKWTSKLGTIQDVAHASPAQVEGTEYGQVVCYMSRSRSATRPPLGASNAAWVTDPD